MVHKLNVNLQCEGTESLYLTHSGHALLKMWVPFLLGLSCWLLAGNRSLRKMHAIT